MIQIGRRGATFSFLNRNMENIIGYINKEKTYGRYIYVNEELNAEKVKNIKDIKDLIKRGDIITLEPLTHYNTRHSKPIAFRSLQEIKSTIRTNDYICYLYNMRLKKWQECSAFTGHILCDI